MKESGQEMRAERKWEQIEPGLVGCGEHFAFTPSELGAMRAPSRGGTGADLGVNRFLLLLLREQTRRQRSIKESIMYI